MSVEFLIASAIGALTMAGIYLCLRARTFPVVLGLALLSYAINLFLFSIGRLTVGQPPIRGQLGVRRGAVGTDDLDRAPRRGEVGGRLHHPRIASARRGVDLLEQRHLVGERHRVERAGVGVEVPVAARRRCGACALGRIEQPQRLARAADGGGGNLVGVGEPGHLP